MVSLSLISYGKTLVYDTSISVKARSFHEFFISFHKGDIVSLEIRELNKKAIGGFTASEFDGRSIYSLKTGFDSVDASFFVPETSVYKIRFSNKSFFSRKYSFKIFRQGATSKSHNFKTKPLWIERVDTIYDIRKSDKIIGFDTLIIEKPVLVLDTCRMTEQIVVDQTVKLESSISMRKRNRAVIEIDLTDHGHSSQFVERRPVAWAYWIGVGKEAEESWHKTVKSVSKLSGSLLSKYVHPLVGFAVGIIPEFFIPATGKNVSFYFVNDTTQSNLFLQNKDFESVEKGRAIVSYGKQNQDDNSKIFLCLHNESAISPIDVSFKIASITEECHYKIQIEKQIQVRAVYKRKAANVPQIVKRKIPVVDE
jgi:hypothetical protein